MGGGMENVISFPARKDDGKSLETIPDTDHNRNGRDEQGPPIGTQAWACNCGCFAFYATPSDWRCYECHTVAVF